MLYQHHSKATGDDAEGDVGHEQHHRHEAVVLDGGESEVGEELEDLVAGVGKTVAVNAVSISKNKN